jgi:hypothetical protein
LKNNSAGWNDVSQNLSATSANSHVYLRIVIGKYVPYQFKIIWRIRGMQYVRKTREENHFLNARGIPFD